MDEFKTEFKYFRKKSPQPDLNTVIDFDKPKFFSSIQPLNIVNNKSIQVDCKECEDLGLISHNLWKIYTIFDKEGFVFIRNPFTRNGEHKWVKKSLDTYTKKPSLSNLDSQFKGLDDIWDLCLKNPEKKEILHKLSWVTFGYHHNWDTKEYSSDNVCEFPPCLKSLTKHVASCLGYENFKPEAGIVNYYHMHSCLRGHVDYSEVDYEAPVISFSFGQTAVFLLGGTTKQEKPLAMFLHSGDIILMGGKSRLAYHGVPLIVKNNSEDQFEENNLHCNYWKPYADYLRTSRLNINIRQVFPL